jgi:hypothetical protein
MKKLIIVLMFLPVFCFGQKYTKTAYEAETLTADSTYSFQFSTDNEWSLYTEVALTGGSAVISIPMLFSEQETVNYYDDYRDIYEYMDTLTTGTTTKIYKGNHTLVDTIQFLYDERTATKAILDVILQYNKK